MTTYTIKNREGKIVGEVASEDPKRAFLLAMFAVRSRYHKAGIEQPMFDADPEFYAEQV